MSEERSSGRGGAQLRRRATLGIGGLLCLVLGLLGAAFSLVATVAAGAITTVVGLLLAKQRRPLGVAVATCGVALIVGVGAYILLGILQPDGAGTGAG